MRTIKVKKYSDLIEEHVAEHAVITPGMLVTPSSANKVRPHNEAEGNAIPMFALEDELQGKNIDVNYAIGDPVQVWIPGRGDQVYAILKDDENVAVGDFLVSAGNGELQKKTLLESMESHAVDSRMTIVAQAIEAVDLSDSSGTWPASRRRIKVRIV